MSWERNFGALVDVESPCSFPELEELAGKRVKLLPLQADHADELFKSIGGDHNAMLYDYMFYGPFSEIEPFRKQIALFANSKDPQFYAICDLKSGQLLGYASFLRIDVAM
jgi:hypothetical protein